jgi:hypothetical protein
LKTLTPDEVVEEENFRIAWSWWSRFPGMKWSFIDKNQENQDI